MNELIEKVAKENGVDPKLLLAICTVESSLNPFAIRYEPSYKYLFFPREIASKLGITETTERVMQSCSIGLGQIMVAVMREYGYHDHIVKAMSNPEIPLMYSAIHLKKYLEKYGDEQSAISSYNQGSDRKTPGGQFQNFIYVDKVSSKLRELRAIL